MQAQVMTLPPPCFTDPVVCQKQILSFSVVWLFRHFVRGSSLCHQSIKLCSKTLVAHLCTSSTCKIQSGLPVLFFFFADEWFVSCGMACIFLLEVFLKQRIVILSLLPRGGWQWFHWLCVVFECYFTSDNASVIWWITWRTYSMSVAQYTSSFCSFSGHSKLLFWRCLMFAVALIDFHSSLRFYSIDISLVSMFA